MPDAHAQFATANDALDRASNVLANGATFAPDFVMRSIIAFRRILALHRPVGTPATCYQCGLRAPCGTVQPIISGVLGADAEEGE